jgi:hypothetical protein
MRQKQLTLKWWYSENSSYEYIGFDSAKIGELYRLKAIEPSIFKLELWSDDFIVISWTKPEEKD